MYGGYYANPRPVGDLLELTGLTGQASTRTSQLSGGQRRKLDLALALTGRPQVLFLDEPTTGFDPAARRDAWTAIAALKDSGTTIILTTHYLEESERLANRVAVITSGRLAYQGPPGDLPGRCATATIMFSLPPPLRTEDLPEQVRVAVSRSADRRVTLTAGSPLRVLRVLAEWAEGGGYEVADLEVFRPSLEDAYLRITESSDAEALR